MDICLPGNRFSGAFYGGNAVPEVKKNRHCLDEGGGSDPCLDFFEGFVHMHCGPSNVIIYHQQVIFPHKSVPYSPEKIIQPHLFNIFTLKHDLRTFVEKMLRVAFTHLYGPNRSGCLDWMGVNLI